MDHGHRDVIQANWSFIVENLSAADCIDHLQQSGCISQDEAETILSPVTSSQKNRALLGVIMRKGPTAFESFCEALEEDYVFIVSKLRRDLEQRRHAADWKIHPEMTSRRILSSVNDDVFHTSDHVLLKGDSLSDHTVTVPESASQRSHSATDLPTADLPGAFHAQNIAYQDMKKRIHHYQRSQQEFVSKGPPSVDEGSKQEFPLEVQRLTTALNEKDRLIREQADLLATYDKNQSARSSELVELQQENDELKRTISAQHSKITALETKVQTTEFDKDVEAKKTQLATHQLRLLDEKCKTLHQELEAKEREIKNLTAEQNKKPNRLTNAQNALSADDAQQLFAVIAERKNEARDLLDMVVSQRRIIILLTQQMAQLKPTPTKTSRVFAAPNVLISQHDGMLSTPTQCTDLQIADNLQPTIYEMNGKTLANGNTTHSSVSENTPSVTHITNPASAKITSPDKHPIGIAAPMRRSDPAGNSSESSSVDRPTQRVGLSQSDSGRSQVKSDPSSALSHTLPTRKKNNAVRNSSPLIGSNPSIGVLQKPQGFAVQDHMANNLDPEVVTKRRALNFEKNVNVSTDPTRGSSSDSVITATKPHNPFKNASSLPYAKPTTRIAQQNVFPEPASNTSLQGAAAMKKAPGEHSDGNVEPQICPVCKLEFSPPLSVERFEEHVTECLNEREDSSDRVCPVCQQSFPSHVSMREFHIHVDNHFEVDLHPV